MQNTIEGMRRMIAGSRDSYHQRAEPHLDDARTREFSASLEAAIGDISPDEAFDALLRWKADRIKPPLTTARPCPASATRS